MSKPGLYFGPPTEEESSNSANTEEDTDILSNLSTRMPSIPAPLASAPQLRIRPIHHIRKDSEKKMPSPLARRGAAEREYLQGQIKAELRERRKQRQHNEDRKMRGSISPKDIEGLKDKDIASSDADVQSIANKFKLGTFGRDGQKGIVNYLPKKTNKDSRGGFGAASPPSLLKKTFTRSVSAVLEDSGIAEDGNLLFYPSGEQIQYEEQKTTTTLHETVEEVESPVSDDGVNALDSKSPLISPASSSDEELSPSLIGADMIWQLGEFNVILDEASTTNQVSKKITLQPKMKYNTPEDNVANCVTEPTQEFKSIEEPPKTVTVQSQNDSVKDAESIAEEEDKRTPLKYESPAKVNIMQASDSFRMLSLNDEELLTRQRLGSVDRPRLSSSPFEFSSPDFKTPDNSENTRTRKSSFGIMPKLPELGMPNMVIDMNDYKKEEEEEEEEEKTGSTAATFETLVKEPLTEAAYKTPDNSSKKSVYRKSLADVHIPQMPIMNGRVETSDPKPANVDNRFQELGLSLDDSDKLSESNFNYTTPEHPGRISRFNQEVHSMPKLPHFSNSEVTAPESLIDSKGEDSPTTPAA